RLAVVFVCDNKQYAISVTMELQSAVPDVAARAPSYGMPGVIVDGNDTLEVYGAVRAAVARARSGGGPSLVECKTYRLLPHTSDDDDRRYRSPEEVQEWRERDPLPRLRRYLAGRGLLSTDAAEAMELEVRVEVDEAARRAEAAAPPPADTAYRRGHAKPLRPTPGVPRELDEAPARGPVAPLRPATGVVRTVLDTVRQTLHDVIDEDERVVVLGADVGLLGGVSRATDGLYAAFGPQRVIDSPL